MIRIIDGENADIRALLAGDGGISEEIEGIVRGIIADVRENGDEALLRYTRKFDCPGIAELRVSSEEIDAAYSSCDSSLISALEEAAENIRAFHKKQLRNGFTVTENEGVVLGQRIIPLESAGLYVPGGTASYPSTVLMDALPAKIAGVGKIVMVTPPGKDGKIPAAVLAAAKIAGVTDIFKIGGAQAIAALAYGTQTVPRVDKIAGPGNAYVAAAKKLVFGQTGIDMIAGPSEIAIIADSASNPKNIAADMLSQAEHDKLARAILLTDSRKLAEAVSAEIEEMIPLLPRKEICRASIDGNGLILIYKDIREAVRACDEIAPEHLELCVDDPFALLPLVKNAASVFLGRYAPEALGDYFAGPNHTLPTSGTARFSSPLSADDFIKKSSFIYYTREALEKTKDKIALIAETEGLRAHAKSVLSRFEGDGQ